MSAIQSISDTSQGLRAQSRAETEMAAKMAKFSTTVIRPVGRWELFGLAELWKFRELVAFLIWRDVKVRYKQTLLGAAWAVIQPVGLTLVFTFFMKKVAAADTGDMPYPLFSFAGTMAWTFFTTSVANAGNSVVGSERMITKIYFPRLSIPLAAVGAAVVDFAIAFGVFLLLCGYYRAALSPMIFLMPVLFLIIMMLALGVGALLAALNVSYRDFRYVIPFLIQIWMFATPSIYSTTPTDHSTWIHLLQALNPMTPLIATLRAACLGGPIDWPMVAAATGMSLVVLTVGCFWFRRTEHTFADRI